MRISRELYTFTIFVLLWFVFLVAIAGADDINATSPSLTVPVLTQNVDTPYVNSTPTITPTPTPNLTQTKTPALSGGDGQDITARGAASDFIIQHPLMHPSKAQLDEEESQFRSVKVYSPPKRSMMFEQGGGATSKSLLSYISYIPSERNQGGCGDCWVWASTGVLEIDHTVQTGINDRLSTQYFNSKYKDGQGSYYACCGGNLQIFTNWYNTDKTPIPWSNTNASFGDRSQSCGDTTAVPISLISTTPHYQLSSTSYSPISTYQDGNAAANIQNAIDNNKAVYYGFYYGNTGWSNFYSFWGSQAESVIWNPDSYGGQPQSGGHATVIVGYDKSDPANPYWVVLNSWGTTSGRPNGLFRLKMNMNYNNTYTSGGSTYAQHKFYVLNSVFDTSAQPAPTVTGIQPSSGINSSSIAITNLAGTNFYGIPTVKLNKTGSSNILAMDVTVVDPTRITCTFPITGVEADRYNVTVINPDGQEAMLGNGFTVAVPLTNVGVYRPSTHSFYLRPGDWPSTPTTVTAWGVSTDIPVTGDWNGDGTTEVGVYRPSTHSFYLRPDDWPSTPTTVIAWGVSTDQPVTSDWNGDGTTEVGVYRPSTHSFYLRPDDWPSTPTTVIAWGVSTDQPVTGKW